MQKTLAEIANLINGEVVGDKNLVVTGFSGIQEAKEGDVTFLANSKYIPLSKTTKASAIITSRDIEVSGKSIIRTDNPSLAFTNLMSSIMEDTTLPFSGIHKTAVIADDCIIGANVSIGPNVIIESQAKIGDNSTIYGGCYIGYKAMIGEDCLLYPNITVQERVTIGNCVIIHSGTVIGSDGFGYIDIEGIHKKIPQVGTVIIEDDVEIGANVTIDRARFNATIVGHGTKIDNLVQIAHNVTIGKNCIIVSLVGISGSVKVGNNVILAGQAGITGHLTIGDGALVYSQTAVTKSVPPYTQISGSPGRPHKEAKRVFALTQRLPQFVKKIEELQEKVLELEKRLEDQG